MLKILVEYPSAIFKGKDAADFLCAIAASVSLEFWVRDAGGRCYTIAPEAIPTTPAPYRESYRPILVRVVITGFNYPDWMDNRGERVQNVHEFVAGFIMQKVRHVDTSQTLSVCFVSIPKD